MKILSIGGEVIYQDKLENLQDSINIIKENKIDLSKSNFENFDFTYYDLSNINFSNSNFNNCILKIVN